MINNKLALSLLKAESSDEIIALLGEEGYWEQSTAWRPLGDDESNFGIINNQQGDPFSALTEKLINSMDAILVGECLKRGIDPESPAAPSSIREAIARFFEGHAGPLGDSDGRVELWEDKAFISSMAKRIYLVASGERKSPNLQVVDDGEGQSPLDFPATFMSIQRANKAKIQFVQGKWNMGGTGVFTFCGDPHNFQVLFSKRDPKLLSADAPSDDHNWGFTVVRKRPPREMERRAVFEYLAPGGLEQGKGEVLQCDHDQLPILPVESPPALYKGQAGHGTLVKMVDYKWNSSEASRSSVLVGKGIYTQIDCCLPYSPLPIRIFEGRNFKSSSAAVTSLGLVNRLRMQAKENMENESPIKGELNVEGQRIPIEVSVFKGGAKPEAYVANYGVLLVVNGQKHGAISKAFFTRKSVNKSSIRKSMVAILDCSYIDREIRDGLFMASRDRMRKNDFYKILESQLASFLNNDHQLKEINNRRRQEELEKVLNDDSPFEDILKKLLTKSPLLHKYFRLGNKVPAPFNEGGSGGGAHSEFDGVKHPTFFHFKKGGVHKTRQAEVGKVVRLEFVTDAVDEYFSRDRYQGSRKVVELGGKSLSGNWGSLHDGVVVFNLSPPDVVDVGETFNLSFGVGDETMISPLTCVCDLEIVEARTSPTSGTSGRGRAPNTGSGKVGSNAHFAIPEIHRSSHLLKKEDGWTEHSAMSVTLEEGKASSFIYNSMNRFLVDAYKESKTDKRLLENQFKLGLALLSLAVIDGYENRSEDQERELDVEGEIEYFTSSVAPVILPIVEALSSISLDDDFEVES
jgi:hypothetical protein